MMKVDGATGVQYEFRTYQRLSKSLPAVPALVERVTRSRAAKTSGSSGCLLALSTVLLAPGCYLLIGLVRGFFNAH